MDLLHLPYSRSSSSSSSDSSSSDTGYKNVECDDDDEALGCNHEWCEDQPGLYKSQFFTAFFINFVSYPFCISICQSIFSKALGPRPQVGTKEEGEGEQQQFDVL